MYKYGSNTLENFLEWPIWWSSIKSFSVTLTISHTTLQTRTVFVQTRTVVLSLLNLFNFIATITTSTSSVGLALSFAWLSHLAITSVLCFVYISGLFFIWPPITVCWTCRALLLLVMALCTLSFPAHLSRATASDPQKSTSFSSQFYWGQDLLGLAQHKFNQVWQHACSSVITFMKELAVLVNLVNKVGFLSILFDFSFIWCEIVFCGWGFYWIKPSIQCNILVLNFLFVLNFFKQFLLKVTSVFVCIWCRSGKGHVGFVHHCQIGGSIIHRGLQLLYWIP